MTDQPTDNDNTDLTALEPVFRAGATVERKADSTSTGMAVAGVTAATATTYRMRSTWTLPRKAPVKLSLGRETLKHKFVKVFKKELQVGDEEFDDLIYITTATLDASRTLLESNDDFRDAVEELVHHGGHVTVDEEIVTITTLGRTPEQATPAPELELRLLLPLVTG